MGDGTAAQDLLDKVKIYLSDDDRRPVADRLTVQSAKIISYQIKAKIYPLTNGPETELVLAAAETQLLQFVHQRRRLALEVSESIVHATLHVEGVRKVVLENWADIVATKFQAPYCTHIELSLGFE